MLVGRLPQVLHCSCKERELFGTVHEPTRSLIETSTCEYMCLRAHYEQCTACNEEGKSVPEAWKAKGITIHLQECKNAYLSRKKQTIT